MSDNETVGRVCLCVRRRASGRRHIMYNDFSKYKKTAWFRWSGTRRRSEMETSTRRRCCCVVQAQCQTGRKKNFWFQSRQLITAANWLWKAGQSANAIDKPLIKRECTQSVVSVRPSPYQAFLEQQLDCPTARRYLEGLFSYKQQMKCRYRLGGLLQAFRDIVSGLTSSLRDGIINMPSDTYSSPESIAKLLERRHRSVLKCIFPWNFFSFIFNCEIVEGKKKFVATFVVDSSGRRCADNSHTSTGLVRLRLDCSVCYRGETCLANLPFTIGHADKRLLRCRGGF